jgi:hypothetical protein
MNNDNIYDTVTISIFTLLSLILVLMLTSLSVSTQIFDTNFILDIYQKNMFPEHKERLLFTLGVVLSPIFLTAYTFFLPIRIKKLFRSDRFLLFFSILGFIFLLMAFKKTHFTLLRGSILHSSPILSIIAIVLFVITKRLVKKDLLKFPKWPIVIEGKLLFIMVSIVIGFISLIQLSLEYNITQNVGNKHHFGVVLFGVQQSLLGKSLLNDFTHLYGQYPLFINPIFKVFGLSITNISILFSLLTGSSLICLWLSLKYIIKNNLISFLTLLSIIYFNFILSSLLRNEVNLYYQYIPIRTFFPTLILLLFISFTKRPTKKLFMLGSLLSLVAMIWNLDTGLIVFITWNLSIIYYFLCYKKESYRRVFFISLSSLGISLVTLLCFIFSYESSYSVLPSVKNLFHYQNIFYKSGFGMIPMPYLHMWNIVLFSYILALGYSVHSFCKKEVSLLSTHLFFLSILGFGLFVYYQGRSHDTVFSFVWYPSLIIIGVCFDRLNGTYLIKTLAQKRSRLILRLFFITIVSISTISFISNIPNLSKKISLNLKDSSAQAPLKRNIEFIKTHITSGEEAFFLAYNDAPFYYYATMTKSFCNVSDMNSIFTKLEVNQIKECLIRNKRHPVIIDSSYRKQNWTIVDESLTSRYVLLERSISGIEIWIPK